MNDPKTIPIDGIGSKEMAKHLRDNTNAVGLETMDRFVVLRKQLLEQVLPQTVQLRKSLGNETVKFVVRAFLRSTFNDHLRKLLFLAGRKINPHQLVNCLFETAGALDVEIDCLAQIDKVHVALILDLDSFLLFVLVRLFTFIVSHVFLVGAFNIAKNLVAEACISFLVRFPFWVVFEDVETVLRVGFVIQFQLVSDLVFLFDDVKLFANGGMLLEALPPMHEDRLDRVLRAHC